ncbi:MAG: nitrilase-related carbon-nitrogen hydrolase [Pseudomonadota bacterium]|nr:nitrilase-related carbon-nitrogen hydrolase [Pseudomonadota bacterium]
MKISICQTEPKLLEIQTNLEEIITKINKYRELGSQLIVFPELALTGYFVGPRYHEVALKVDSPEIKQLVAATRGTAAIVGFIEESRSMNFYNAALVAVDGELQYCCRKLNLPNYGVFEEKKYFSHGKRISGFKLNGFNITVFICNDLWHPSLPYLGITQKTDIMVTIFNSSQGSMGDEFCNIESWGIINTFYSRIFGIYNICANRVGYERPRKQRAKDRKGEEVEDLNNNDYFRFWGGSEIINPFGKRVAQACLHEPDEISAEIDKDMLRKKKILLPYLRNDDPHFTHRELSRILYTKKR